MKTLAIFSVLILTTQTLIGQVSFSIVEPADISGGYTFTSNGDAPNWGLADLNDPADAVLDTVVIVEDGLPGLNAQGIPFSNEGCNPLINDLTGKIAFVYRYDGVSTNDCYAGTKVLNAQNAGAVGVILVNRDESVFGYNGTTDGPLTNIPFAFISKSDGATIRAKLDAGEDVVAFIGNKLGFYSDDAGIVDASTLAPTESCTPSQTALDGSEFGFNVGTKIYNYGTNTQSNVMLTATVTGAGGTWTETAGPFSINSGDSVDVFTGGTNDIPAFSFTSYPDGVYHLNYNIDIGTTDEMDFDNDLNYVFSVSDEVVTFSEMDTITGKPNSNMYTRSADPSFAGCMVYRNANASRLGAAGMYFEVSSTWQSGLETDGEFITATLYEWDDSFVDVNDGGFGFSSLTDVADGDYIFIGDLDSTMLYVPFDDPVILDDNQRYLACIDLWHPDMTLGYNNTVDYSRNINDYAQPLVPVNSGGTYFWVGFQTDMVPAIGLRIFDEAELDIVENQEMRIRIFPNPATNELNISMANVPQGLVEIRDMAGRLTITSTIYSGGQSIDVSELQSGQYVITVIGADGSKSSELFGKL